MTGCIDNVDLDLQIFLRIIDFNRSVFCQDGNPALALKVIRIQDAFHDLLVFAEYPGLLEHPIYQGGFSVVYVGHDGDISQIFAF